MVEQIIISPEKIRGNGNIVSPAHSAEEYTRYQSVVNEGTEIVNGIETTVFGLVYNALDIVISSYSTITVGETVSITGQVSSHAEPVEGMTVKLYIDDTLIDTATSSNLGEVSFTYTPEHAGGYSMYLKVEGNETYGANTSTIRELIVNQRNTNITLNTSNANVSQGQTFTLSGQLTGVSGVQTVDLYEWGTLIDTLTTDSNGNFSKTLSKSFAAGIVYNVVYEGTIDYASATSDPLIQKIKWASTNNLSLSSNSVYVGQSVTISGRVAGESSEGVSTSVLIQIYGDSLANSYESYRVNSDDSGNYSKTVTLPTGNYSIKSIAYSNNDYSSSNSATSNLTVSKYGTVVSVNTHPYSYASGDSVEILVNSRLYNPDVSFNPTSISVTFNGVTSTVTQKKTGYDNIFLFTVPGNISDGEYSITASYTETSTHNSALDTDLITVDNRIVDELVLTNSGKTIYMYFKKNRGNVTGTTFEDVELHITGTPTAVLSLNPISTNDSGYVQASLNDMSGQVYFTWNGLTSNLFCIIQNQ